jgi:hypothetical protein
MKFSGILAAAAASTLALALAEDAPITQNNPAMASIQANLQISKDVQGTITGKHSLQSNPEAPLTHHRRLQHKRHRRKLQHKLLRLPQHRRPILLLHIQQHRPSLKRLLLPHRALQPLQSLV